MSNKFSLLERRVKREVAARKSAESILEQKSMELYETNKKLQQLNSELENLVADRTFKLARSEERYREVVDNAHDIIFITDKSGIITFINHSAEARFNKPKSTIVGNHFSQFIKVEYQEEVVKKFINSIKLQKPSLYLEFPSFKLNDRWVWLGQNIQFNYDKEGQMFEAVTIARDITEQKLEEQQLIGTQLQLSSLINNMAAGILFQSKHGEVLQINPFFCQYFGLEESPEKLIGEKISSISNQVLEHFKDFEEKLDKLIKSPKKSLGNELRLKDGRFIKFDFIPIFSSGNFLGSLWQFHDITEQKELELLIRNSEEKYRGIIENMELGLMEVDANGIILRAYDWFCKMTGYTEEELIGKDGKDFLLAPEYISILDENHAKRAKGEQSVYEVELIKKSGERIWVIISGAPFYNLDGEVIGSVGIHFDITDQKNLEKELIRAKETAEDAQEAEQKFLANMSHEIRTPLNAVIGMSHLLYDTNPTPHQKEYLDMIQYSANLLSNLVTEVLDFSKITSGIVDLNETDFDLNAMLQTLYKTFELKAQNKPLNIELEKPEFNTLVHGDETMINQVLYNLLGNAEKFTESGTIRLFVEQTLKDGWYEIAFHVSDSGIGISEEKIKSIFNEFSQEDRETKLKYGGTGLGLAITKNIVELLNGTIKVESKKHVGSTFSVFLRLKDTGKQVKALKTNTFNFQGASRILVVEDNVMNQNYISRLLDSEGLDYEIADNGQIAFDLCRKMSFNLIFMDISMPVMDGYETTIKIRNSNTANKNTPIIALTASALATKKSKAFDVGMNDYMTKPFTPHELKLKLSEYLGKLSKEEVEQNQTDETQTSTILDKDVLAMYYDGDDEYAHDMFKMFLDQYGKSMNQLSAAIENKNWDEGQKITHKMKPTFSMVGAPSIQKLFQELENSLRFKNEEQIKVNWKNVLAELSLYIPAIHLEFDRLKASI